MDEQPAYTRSSNRLTAGSRARRVVIALAVAGALAAVPAGVALAGSSDDSTGSSGGATKSADPRGGNHRGDCPERDLQGSQDSQDSAQI
jgi:hypothetical protein